MKLSPWFQVGEQGTPHRSGDYLWEIWIDEETDVWLHASFLFGDNKIVTDDGRFIGLTYEDYWRGVLKNE